MFGLFRNSERREVEKHLERLRENRKHYSIMYTQRILDLCVNGASRLTAEQDEEAQYYRQEIDEHYKLIKEFEEKLEGME